MPLSSDLKLRIISSVILIPPVLYALISGGLSYQILILLAAVVMSFEWNNMISYNEQVQLNIKQRTRWDLLGIIYIVVPTVSLLTLRSSDHGLIYILWLFISVWSVDIAAYFAGKTIGGPKIWVKISPNKTWSGLLGGILGAVIVAIIFSFFVSEAKETKEETASNTAVQMQAEPSSDVQPDNVDIVLPELSGQSSVSHEILEKPSSHSMLFFVFIGGLLAIVAQIGDFFESWVKRYFGLKDSGSTIPGHGGLLDRVDGLLLAAPFLLLILSFSGYVAF